MTHCRLVSLVFGIAVAAILSVRASAQGMDNKQIVVNVALSFYVGETSFPAGSYTISAPNIGASAVMIRPSSGRNSSTLPVIARLPGSAHATTSSLSFDDVGDRRYLSEIWIQGREGYRVRDVAKMNPDAVVSLVE